MGMKIFPASLVVLAFTVATPIVIGGWIGGNHRQDLLTVFLTIIGAILGAAVLSIYLAFPRHRFASHWSCTSIFIGEDGGTLGVAQFEIKSLHDHRVSHLTCELTVNGRPLATAVIADGFVDIAKGRSVIVAYPNAFAEPTPVALTEGEIKVVWWASTNRGTRRKIARDVLAIR